MWAHTHASPCSPTFLHKRPGKMKIIRKAGKLSGKSNHSIWYSKVTQSLKTQKTTSERIIRYYFVDVLKATTTKVIFDQPR